MNAFDNLLTILVIYAFGYVIYMGIGQHKDVLETLKVNANKALDKGIFRGKQK